MDDSILLNDRNLLVASELLFGAKIQRPNYNHNHSHDWLDVVMKAMAFFKKELDDDTNRGDGSHYRIMNLTAQIEHASSFLPPYFNSAFVDVPYTYDMTVDNFLTYTDRLLRHYLSFSYNQQGLSDCENTKRPLFHHPHNNNLFGSNVHVRSRNLLLESYNLSELTLDMNQEDYELLLTEFKNSSFYHDTLSEHSNQYHTNLFIAWLLRDLFLNNPDEGSISHIQQVESKLSRIMKQVLNPDEPSRSTLEQQGGVSKAGNTIVTLILKKFILTTGCSVIDTKLKQLKERKVAERQSPNVFYTHENRRPLFSERINLSQSVTPDDNQGHDPSPNRRVRLTDYAHQGLPVYTNRATAYTTSNDDDEEPRPSPALSHLPARFSVFDRHGDPLPLAPMNDVMESLEVEETPKGHTPPPRFTLANGDILTINNRYSIFLYQELENSLVRLGGRLAEHIVNAYY